MDCRKALLNKQHVYRHVHIQAGYSVICERYKAVSHHIRQGVRKKNGLHAQLAYLADIA